jgi:hypothetical protein
MIALIVNQIWPYLLAGLALVEVSRVNYYGRLTLGNLLLCFHPFQRCFSSVAFSFTVRNGGVVHESVGIMVYFSWP